MTAENGTTHNMEDFNKENLIENDIDQTLLEMHELNDQFLEHDCTLSEEDGCDTCERYHNQ